MDDWPTCPERVSFFGDLELDCTLRKGHQFDGEPSHLSSHTDAGVVQWSLTYESSPGPEPRRGTGR